MYKNVTSQELEQLIKNENITVVDVREQDEYQSGHIPGVKNAPLSDFPENIHLIDKSKKNYIVCAAGGRSSMACDFLSAQGYDVVNVDGGMTTWKGAIE